MSHSILVEGNMKSGYLDIRRFGPSNTARAVRRIAAMLTLLGGIGIENAAGAVLRVPEDFVTIQEAVDAAVPGDVIRVGPGVYHERVTIAKSEIRLEADPVHAAILDGATFTTEGPAISVLGTSTSRVHDVSIVGFRIENQLGAGISLVLADRCEIRSNRVSHTAAQSIALTRSTFNLVADNTLADGTIGVGLSTVSNDNTVKENTITGAFIHGIRVSMVNQTPLRNVIKENLVCAQDASSLTGVLIAGFASGNIVKENRIVGNGGKTAGIRLELETTGNLVKENVLNRHAIDIDDLGTGNTVKENERHRSLRCP